MQIKVNGKKIKCDPKKTLLHILREQGVEIPTLCYQEGLKPAGRCRLCVVEVKGKLISTCDNYPSEGMEILTNSEKVLRSRKINAELLMPDHMAKCMIENKQHDLCKIIADLGITEVRFDPKKKYKVDLGASVIRDDNLCINCGRCVDVCADVQATWAIDFAKRGHSEHVTPYCEHNLHDVACTKCGQCAQQCYYGALKIKEGIK